MERKRSFLALLGAATLGAGMVGCVYVPPPPHVLLRRPPPPPAVVYGDVMVDSYYGPGRPRRHGRTQYLREYDPDYVPPPSDPADAPGDPDDSAMDAGADEDLADAPSLLTPPQQPTPPPAPEKKIDPSSVPAATRGSAPGRVKSPYPPYRELDVSGMTSGSLAKDPVSGKVFRIP